MNSYSPYNRSSFHLLPYKDHSPLYHHLLIGIKTREGIEGEKAVDYLTNLLPMTFTVKTKLDDNMILGEIMTQGESINQKMLDSGLVDKYGE